MPFAVIITALPVEYLAVRAHLSELREVTHPQGTIYEQGQFAANKQMWDVGIVEIGAGNVGAALEVERAIAYFNPEVVLFVGIAVGVKDVALGDVVVASNEPVRTEERFWTRPEIGRLSYAVEQWTRSKARKTGWLRRISLPTSEQIPHIFRVIASTQLKIFQFVALHFGDEIMSIHKD